MAGRLDPDRLSYLVMVVRVGGERQARDFATFEPVILVPQFDLIKQRGAVLLGIVPDGIERLKWNAAGLSWLLSG